MDKSSNIKLQCLNNDTWLLGYMDFTRPTVNSFLAQRLYPHGTVNEMPQTMKVSVAGIN